MSVALHHQVIVAGRPMSGGGPPLEVRFPFTGERVAWLSGVSSSVMDEAIAGALAAFESYRRTPAHARAALLDAVGDVLQARAAELARDHTLETGRPIGESQLECAQAVAAFRHAATEAARISGEIVPLDGSEAGAGRLGETRRFPLGPLAAITPATAPLSLVAHRVATALASGSSIVVKPAPTTPLSALRVGHAVLEASAELDLPPGIIGVVPCTDRDVEPLVTDPRIRALSFSGSSRKGWALRALAGQKRVTLDLGDNSAAIVHADADIAHAAERCAHAAFLAAGQLCSSTQRVYVHESVADAFTRLLVGHAEQLVAGDPREPATQLGPMRNEAAAEETAAWLAEAVAEGAQIRCGGTRDGVMFAPTVVTGTQHHMRIVCEEALAPVVVVERYSELDEAIAATNASVYGRQASVFSNDLEAVYRAYAELDVASVIVNDVHAWRIEQVPYAGAKSSGLGGDGVRQAIAEQTQERLLVLNPERRA